MAKVINTCDLKGSIPPLLLLPVFLHKNNWSSEERPRHCTHIIGTFHIWRHQHFPCLPIPIHAHKGEWLSLSICVLFLPFMPVRSIALSVLSKTGELRLKGDVTTKKHGAAAQTKKAILLKWILFSSILSFWCVCIHDPSVQSILIELVTATKCHFGNTTEYSFAYLHQGLIGQISTNTRGEQALELSLW